MTKRISISSAERVFTARCCLTVTYEADAYFPDLDSDPEWEITADSDEQVYFDITYQFLKYERKKA